MLQRFYKLFLPVYFGQDKRQFCCNNCIWFDDSKKQDCLNCKVNVLACTCYEFSEHGKKAASFDPLNNMVTAIGALKKVGERRQKELFDQENGVSHDYTPPIFRRINVKRNADGLLAKQVHNNDSLYSLVVNVSHVINLLCLISLYLL